MARSPHHQPRYPVADTTNTRLLGRETCVGGLVGHDQVDPSDSLTGDNAKNPLNVGYSPPDRPAHSWRGQTSGGPPHP